MFHFLSQQKSISYADDGLFYSNEPFEIKDMPEWGVYIHPEKSGWVKWNDKWIKPVKFLGLTWDGEKVQMDTRKGSRLIANSKKEALAILTKDFLTSVKGLYSIT